MPQIRCDRDFWELFGFWGELNKAKLLPGTVLFEVASFAFD